LNDPFRDEAGGPPTPPPTAPPPTAPPPPGGVVYDDVFEEDFSSDLLLIPEGQHPARLTEVERTTSKSGNPMYVWDFIVTDGPAQGMTCRMWTSLAPAARWRVMQTLQGLGLDAEGQVVRFSRSQIVGLPCLITIQHRDFDGAPAASIQRVDRI
jgi:hypothetical protein